MADQEESFVVHDLRDAANKMRSLLNYSTLQRFEPQMVSNNVTVYVATMTTHTGVGLNVIGEPTIALCLSPFRSKVEQDQKTGIQSWLILMEKSDERARVSPVAGVFRVNRVQTMEQYSNSCDTDPTMKLKIQDRRLQHDTPNVQAHLHVGDCIWKTHTELRDESKGVGISGTDCERKPQADVVVHFDYFWYWGTNRSNRILLPNDYESELNNDIISEINRDRLYTRPTATRPQNKRAIISKLDGRDWLLRFGKEYLQIPIGIQGLPADFGINRENMRIAQGPTAITMKMGQRCFLIHGIDFIQAEVMRVTAE